MHVYATVAEFRRYIENGTSATTAQDDDSLILTFLESASRRIDGFVNRSRFGSAFGPRVGMNRYDALHEGRVYLNDDLLTATLIQKRADTGGTATTLVDATDYYLQPYDTPRKRILEAIIGGSFPTYGERVVEVTGTWGYSDEREVLSVTLAGGGLTTSATSVTTSAAHGLSPGNTILIDSEQMTVTAASGSTLTVKRAQNGTTATVHAAGAAISKYTYEPDVVVATLQLAQRRYKSRQAGIPAEAFGGQGATPISTDRGGEASILYNTVGHLRLMAVG